MLILRYLRWNGTGADFREYVSKLKSCFNEIDDVKLKGVFEPLSAWHYVFLFEASNNERFLEALHSYSKKYGRHPNITLIKAELLYPFE